MHDERVIDLSSDVPAAVGRRHFLALVGAGLAAAGLPAVGPGVALARTAGGDGDNISRRYGIEDPPVVTDQDPGQVLLDQNENQLGPGPRSRLSLIEAVNVANRYPDAEGRLVSQLADLHGVNEACVLPGCGSTELLKMCADAATGPGKNLIQAFPTYATIDRYAQNRGAELIEVRCDARGRLDLPAMLDRVDDRTGCVYLCNPNNPTGGINRDVEVRAFLDEVRPGVLTVVDEAYHDYVADPGYRTQIPPAVARPDVVVLRTFSKVYGLAGLRIGYAIAHPETIGRLEPHRLILDLNNPGLYAAMGALQDRAFYDESVRVNSASRDRLMRELSGFGLQVFPSQAGFVWIDFGRPTEPIRQALADRHVYVRTYRHSPNQLRISTGTARDMDRLLVVLKELIG